MATINKREFAAKLKGSKESKVRRAALKARQVRQDRELRNIDRAEVRNA